MCNNPKLAILYARFSPRSDAEKCESIETQLERLRAWCVATGREVVAEYDDREASGKSMDGRDGLAKALAHVEEVKGVLVVYKLDRLVRSTKDAIEISERLEASHCDLASLNETIDTSTPTGRAFYAMMAVFAQLEREQISQRTSDAMLRHQDAGRRMGHQDRIPYGKRLAPGDPSRMLDDDYELGILATIDRLHRDGVSLRGICAALDGLKLKRRGGKAWNGAYGFVRSLVRRLEKEAEAQAGE